MNKREQLSQREDYAAGALLGTFAGDALGMPVEGYGHRRIQREYGQVDEMLDARLGRGTYTDDTQMAIATAKSLLECGGVAPEDMAGKFLEHFNPDRGYGHGTKTVFRKWQNGVPVAAAAGEVFDGGSYGNGGSMRIAPVGIYYAGDPEQLQSAVRKACGLTHAHPLGIGSSFLQALSVSRAFQLDKKDKLEPVRWVEFLREALPAEFDADGILHQKLELIEELLGRDEQPVEFNEVVQKLGCSSKAFESVPASIYAFLANPDSFRDAVVYGIGIGGDTDTIGAMVGALAGARHGVCALPEEWWAVLENGPDGRDDVLGLGRELVAPGAGD